MISHSKDKTIVSGVPPTKQGSFKRFVVQGVGVNSNSRASIHREEIMKMVIYANTKVQEVNK